MHVRVIITFLLCHQALGKRLQLVSTFWGVGRLERLTGYSLISIITILSYIFSTGMQTNNTLHTTDWSVDAFSFNKYII